MASLHVASFGLFASLVAYSYLARMLPHVREDQDAALLLHSRSWGWSARDVSALVSTYNSNIFSYLNMINSYTNYCAVLFNLQWTIAALSILLPEESGLGNINLVPFAVIVLELFENYAINSLIVKFHQVSNSNANISVGDLFLSVLGGWATCAKNALSTLISALIMYRIAVKIIENWIQGRRNLEAKRNTQVQASGVYEKFSKRFDEMCDAAARNLISFFSKQSVHNERQSSVKIKKND
jgi:hypothetical protein